MVRVNRYPMAVAMLLALAGTGQAGDATQRLSGGTGGGYGSYRGIDQFCGGLSGSDRQFWRLADRLAQQDCRSSDCAGGRIEASIPDAKTAGNKPARTIE